ncbi:MAG: hypothetical protein QMC93_00600 [Patescibacteria group bacterium]|nr:hypothetical protein [Patescibacteria group bacterium]
MVVVNFTIPKTLERRIKKIIRKKGFNSRAEFFRFAALQFIDIIDKPTLSEDERFDYLTRALSDEIVKKYRYKKFPSLQEQLADL